MFNPLNWNYIIIYVTFSGLISMIINVNFEPLMFNELELEKLFLVPCLCLSY